MLEGYRSIKKVDLVLKPGLNLIIGKNGSGKTNFFNFFDAALNLNLDNYLDFNANITLGNEDDLEIRIQRRRKNHKLLDPKNATITPSNIDYALFLNNEPLPIREGIHDYDISKNRSVNFQSNIIKHGIPKELPIIEKPYAFIIDRNGNPNIDFSFITDSANSFYLRSILAQLSFPFLDDNEEVLQDLEFIKTKILKMFNKALEDIKSDLAKYTPIEDIRLNEGISFFYDNTKKEATVNNICLDFKVENSWMPFSSLSDGTKRIFLIVSDLSCDGKYFFKRNSFGMSNAYSRIVLIEEPELGIHPHQLHLLMNFLKEQSQSKQIIVTTHSPQALDSIAPNEFDRIIICQLTENNGTTLIHMTDEEKKNASDFMNDGMYFSDFWRFTNFNRI